MNVILFGATGMVGQGTLHECLNDPRVTKVLAVGRTPTGKSHPKLTELIHKELTDYSSVESQLTGYDACLFCLGITSAGMTEADYTKVTYDIAVAAGTVLSRLNPQMTMCFVSGASTDSTEQGKTMWARVKGRTENALLKLPFKAAYMFRPAFIRPMNGVVSKTTSYRILYAVMRPLSPVIETLFPKVSTTSERLGRAMINAAIAGAPKTILESPDLDALGRITA